jgi:NitT/TauT family transport system substrate-binding protein
MVKLNRAMDAVSMKEAAEVQKSFILGAGAPAQELGKMTMERWGTLVNQLYDLKLIKTKPVADKLFQNF